MSKKILIIDDSALMRRVISDIINQNNEYEVDAIAKDGLEGFELIVSNPNRYSAVILDINMPKMNGLELLEKLQKNRIEQTIIVVSTVAKEGAKETIKALEFGAFDFVTKPENYLETKSDNFKNRLYEMLNIATNCRQSIKRTSVSRMKSTDTSKATEDKTTKPSKNSVDALTQLIKRNSDINSKTEQVNDSSYKGVKVGKSKVVALACSTGGPKSLQQVVPLLPANLDAGVVLVQHMPKGFTLSLAQRLNEISQINVKEAQDGDIIKKGWVYIAPGGRHLKVVKKGTNSVVQLNDEPPIEALRPCANVMYKSLATCSFDEVTCVVLTGMGADGTKGIQELATLRKNIHVIAQDEESCIVYGMPKAIAQTGLVDEIVPLNLVADAITKNVGVS